MTRTPIIIALTRGVSACFCSSAWKSRDLENILGQVHRSNYEFETDFPIADGEKNALVNKWRRKLPQRW